jgi:hypothetical protein
MNLRNVAYTTLVALAFTTVTYAQGLTTAAGADTGFQIRYAANLDKGESFVDISNTGFNGVDPRGPGFGTLTGDICVNVYAFDSAEELVSCCSCLVTPNQTVNLGVNRDLTAKTLTGVIPTSVTIKLVASSLIPPASGPQTAANACNNSAAVITAGQVFPNGMAAWGTTTHAGPGIPSVGFATTETPFTAASLSAAELLSITGRCTGIIGNASGYGICSSCRAGALGGSRLPQ